MGARILIKKIRIAIAVEITDLMIGRISENK